jgi:uncharacterized protein with NRDE domain
MKGSMHNDPMCVIAFHWQPEDSIPLTLVTNRDEFYERPTAPMAWWEGDRILAGRDLRAGGTWLGVTRAGRCAALTNVRDPEAMRTDRASRGQLPVRFLEGQESAAAFVEALRPGAASFNPFNLLLFDGVDLLGYESGRDRVLTFTPGIHAVSNGDFDEPWPKVETLKASLAAGSKDNEALLDLLSDREAIEDHRLPSTGVSLEWERALAPIFIRTSTYGTRASTIVRLGREVVSMVEQRFSPEGAEGRSHFEFQRA